MEIYQAKDINKEDIDNIVKVIYNKFEEEKSKEEKEWSFYDTTIINLNNVEFSFIIKCNFHKEGKQKEDWNLIYVIENDRDIISYINDKDDYINYKYFQSKTLRELIVKYVNTKFVYDKCDSKIMRYDDYLEKECVRKLFHTNIECCVCYDNLSYNLKTKCGHRLCLDCYNKIKGKKLCPMCKACLCCGEQEENDDCDDY